MTATPQPSATMTVTPQPTATVTPRPLALRNLAERIVGPYGKRFKIGIYLEPEDMNDPTGTPERLAAEEFNHRVVNGIDQRFYKGGNRWDFSRADSLVQKALSANQSMIGMALLWGWAGVIPDWIKNGGYTRNQLIAIMENHIASIMMRYKGSIGAYVVVNEAYKSDSGGDWLDQYVGSDYLRIAFQIARQTDPSAVLIYNHYANHTKRGGYYAITRRDVNSLKDQGLIDAVGLQLHLNRERPSKADVIEAMQSYGLPVWITEFDCYQNQNHANPPEEQALITKNMIEAALESSVCDHFTVWGFSDKNSFSGPQYKTCLWDESNNAKPSYYAIQQVWATWAK